jgi:hypothetical protein
MKQILSVFFQVIIITFPAVNALAQVHSAESPGTNFVRVGKDDTPARILQKASNIVPCRRQYEWQEMEFIAFTHFGMNTFTLMILTQTNGHKSFMMPG